MAAVLVLLLLFTATINITLRRHSRARAFELLQRAGRAQAMRRMLEIQHELAVCVAALRIAITLTLTLVVHRLLGQAGIESLRLHYVLSFLVTLAIVVVFGAAIPSAWSRYAGEPLLVHSLSMLFGLRVALFPLMVVVRMFDALVRRLAGVPDDNDDDELARHEKELLEAVSEGKLAGAVNEEEQEMIESIIEFRDSDVSEIMTPRTEIEAVERTATLADIKDLIARIGHSRIPIYDENIDNIVGVIYAKDLLQVGDYENFDTRQVMREALFVPETKNVRDLLHEFRTRKVHMAIVLDEYGGTAGLVTIEDILEELVGDIVDEYDEDEPAILTRIDPQTVDIDARMRVDEINEVLGISLPEEDDFETVGGFVFSTLGRIPHAGERCTHGNVEIEVIDAEPRRINRLRLRVLSAVGDSDAGV